MSDDMDKIVQLVQPPEFDHSVQDVLDDEEFSTARQVLVLAWDKEDNFYANSNMKRSDAIFILEMARKFILDL